MAMALLITSTLRIFEIYSLISNRVADSWITPRYGGKETLFRGRLNPVGKPSCRTPTGKRKQDYPISKSTLYQKASQKEIPYHKINNKRLVFYRSELEEWIRQRTTSVNDSIDNAVLLLAESPLVQRFLYLCNLILIYPTFVTLLVLFLFLISSFL